MTDVIKDLIGDDNSPESSSDNLNAGLKMIQEKYGVTLSPNDPNLLGTLSNIRTSQIIFQDIVNNDANRNCQNHDFPPPQHQSTPISCTRQSDVDTISKDTFDFSIYKDPSIQNDPLHSGGSGVDQPRHTPPIEQPESLHSHNGDSKKQELGETLYPLVHKSHPTKSNKLTGMLLDLPNDEILNIIDSETLLSEYIEMALAALNCDDQNEENSLQLNDAVTNLDQSTRK